MTADLTSTPGATRRERVARLLWRLETPAGLGVMFAVAFAIRVALAPYVGFKGDLRLFQLWATRLADVGPHRFYVEGQFQDYPPGYLYVLWLTGKLSAAPGYLLLKLPAILADLGLAWIAGTLAARLAPPSVRQRLPVRALVAAGVLFNPAVIALSAGWGQVDAVPAIFVLLSLLLLFTGPQSLRRELTAFLAFAVAIAMKPQAGFVLPVMLYALYRRYLHRRSTQELFDGALSIALVGVSSLALWAVSGLAFGLGPIKLVRFYQHSASVYPVTSANAFNFWGAIAFWRNDSVGDNVLKIAGISALHFGELALLVGIALVLWRVHRAIERGVNEARVLTIGAAIISLLAYTLLTRMHERYMFLALACLAPLAFSRPLRLAYGGLSALFVLNLWYPFAYFNSQWGVRDFHYQPVFDWVFGGFANDTWQKRIWSLAVTAIVFGVAWVTLRGAERAEPEAADSPPTPRLRTPLPALPMAERLRSIRDRSPAVRVDTRTARWVSYALVALTCVFCLVILRSETKYANNLNDSSFHLQMVQWADGQIREGRVPLDGWYPYFAMGSSHFHHYQSLPHTLTAYAAHATGQSDQRTYLWIQYLLLALWPIAVYLAARLLDWGRLTAASAAAISPLIVSASGYGYEHGSYTWRGYGVYSQLWGMWLLPLAWGLTWRAVARGKRYAAAAAALALTIACHFITGYLALLTVGVWVIVFAADGFLRKLGRAAVVAVGSLLIGAWVLVPLVGDTKWTTQSQYYRGSIFNDSYGARTILGWLFKGELFDNGRFPIVTLLFFAGVVVCGVKARHELRARALLGAFTLSLLLFFGRRTWGGLIDLLPGMGDVQIHRFVVGVHLAGILIAGVGLSWLLRTAYSFCVGRLAVPRAAAAAAVPMLLAIGVLAPAWTERAGYDLHDSVLISNQQAVERTDGRDIDKLVAIVKARHDGRAYAGIRSNWGQDFRVGAVHAYAWLADRQVDAIGFTFRTIASLSTDVEASFDETKPSQYQMLNVRYLLFPYDRKPSVPAKLIASSGNYRLWQVRTTGYFQVVDRASAIAADRKNLNDATADFRNSDLASRGIYPGIAFAGAQGPPPTFSGANPQPGPPGHVLSQNNRLQDGVFDATVEANRPAVVLLKASYDPRWTVTVDGTAGKPVMMAPSLVGVAVAAGRHEIHFRYKPYSHYPVLFTVGVLALLGLALIPHRAALRRRLAKLVDAYREPQVAHAVKRSDFGRSDGR